MAIEKRSSTREFLLLSDFDQTLSFKDSRLVLSEMMQIPHLHERITTVFEGRCRSAITISSTLAMAALTST